MFKKTLIGTAFGLAALLGSSFVQAATVFDFTTLGVVVGDFGTTVSGVDVAVSGGTFTNPGVVTPGGVTVGTSLFGVGVYSGGFDSPVIDGFGANDVAIFDFSKTVELVSATFGFIGSNDQFTLFVDDFNDGSLEVKGFDFDPTGSGYSFAPGFISNLFGIGAVDNNDRFTVKSLTVSVVPLPPSLILFGGALLGLGWISRRKKQTTRL